MPKLQQQHKLLLLGVTLGILYGGLARWIFGQQATLNSVTFLFVIPMILGIIPLMFADEDKLRAYRNIIFIPWLTVFAFFAILYFSGVEDFMCLLVLAAPFFILGTLGALIYRLGRINRGKRGVHLALVLLPFLLGPLEDYIQSPSETFEINSQVVIQATPKRIWDNIVEVPPIKPEEYNAGFFNALGIPRPISASVDKKAVGGQRIGRFEGGLRFVERITAYQENQKVSFDIQIDPRSVRPKVFDQHVLKGNYFTFVDASYDLTDLGGGKVRLTLSSSYQLTSKLNFYGKFWGDWILADFQERLLEVIKNRCERGAKIRG